MDGAMGADRDRDQSRPAPQAKARGRRRSRHRRAFGPRLNAWRVRELDRCRHVMALRRRSILHRLEGATRVAVVIGAVVTMMHVANLRVLVTSARAHVRGGRDRRQEGCNPGSPRTAPLPTTRLSGDRRPTRRRPAVGHLVQPEPFMEVTSGGDRAWRPSSGAIRSSSTRRRSCRFFGDALAGSMRRPPHVASGFLTPSPRLDEPLRWLLIRLDWAPRRVNDWERDTR